MKKPIVVNQYHISNADALLELVSDMYSPDQIRETLNDIIYNYSRLNVRELGSDGQSIEKANEVNDQLFLLKSLSDSLKNMEVLPILEQEEK